jgi:hypothetical protein
LANIHFRLLHFLLLTPEFADTPKIGYAGRRRGLNLLARNRIFTSNGPLRAWRILTKSSFKINKEAANGSATR